jgi:hypothetical protein
MGAKAPDLSGRHFGRLLVIERVPRRPKAPGPARWVCLCDPELGGCGAVTAPAGNALRSGYTRSCGCLRADVNAARNRKRAADRRAASGL